MTLGIWKAKTLVSSLLGPRHRARQRVRRELAKGEPELALLPLLADPARDFLDVGANDGVYSFYALPYFRRVYAAEPHPDLAGPLRRVIEPRGRVIASALSDQEGVARLWIPRRGDGDLTTRSSLEADANPGFEQREIEVRLTTIDALGLDALALIKIDVEGHEFAALRGAVKTLAAAKPLCIVECEERHNSGGVARAFAFFGEHDYRAYYLHRNRLCDGADFDPARLQRVDDAKQVGAERSPDYVNNFIFAHPQNDAGLKRIRAAHSR